MASHDDHSGRMKRSHREIWLAAAQMLRSPIFHTRKRVRRQQRLFKKLGERRLPLKWTQQTANK